VTKRREFVTGVIIDANRIARIVRWARAAIFLTPHRSTATIEKVTRFQATSFNTDLVY